MNMIALYALVVVDEGCGAWELSVDDGASYQTATVEAGTYRTLADLLAEMQEHSEEIDSSFRWNIVRSSDDEGIRTRLSFQGTSPTACLLRFPEGSQIGTLLGFSRDATDTPDSYSFSNAASLESDISPKSLLVTGGVSYHDNGDPQAHVRHSTMIEGTIHATRTGISKRRCIAFDALTDTQWDNLIHMYASLVSGANVANSQGGVLSLDLEWRERECYYTGDSREWIRLLPETYGLKHMVTWASPQPRYAGIDLSFTEVD